MVDRLLPYRRDQLNNSAFASELAKLSWPRSRAELATYAAIVFVCLLVTGIAAWFAERFVLHLNTPVVESYVADALMLVSIGAIFLASLYEIGSAAKNSATRLQIAMLADGDSARATLADYDALIQVRLWRISVIECALRFTTLSLFYLELAYEAWRQWTPLLTIGNSNSVSFISFLLPDLSVNSLFFDLIITLLILPILLEPLIRMRALTAVEVALQLRSPSRGLALFAGIIVAAGIHLLQVAIIVAVVTAFRGIPPSKEREAAIADGFLLLCAGYFLIVVTTYTAYFLIRRMSLILSRRRIDAMRPLSH